MDLSQAEQRFVDVSQEIGTDLLRTLDDVCERLDVPYVIFYGTLLGAVRYHSWIPWDDDVDVAMFRADFERFRTQVSRYLPDHVQFSDVRSNPDHLTAIPRLLDRRTRRPAFRRPRKTICASARHVALDIFILDKAPTGRFRHWLWRRRIRLLEKLVVATGLTVRDAMASGPTARTVVEVAGVVMSRIAPSQTWRERHARRCAAYQDSTSPYVSVTNGWTLPTRARLLRVDSAAEGRRVQFGELWPTAPRDADAILAQLYGPRFVVPPPHWARRPMHFRKGLIVDFSDRREEILPS